MSFIKCYTIFKKKKNPWFIVYNLFLIIYLEEDWKINFFFFLKKKRLDVVLNKKIEKRIILISFLEINQLQASLILIEFLLDFKLNQT